MQMKHLSQYPVVDIALTAIRRNRLQTLLTMVGISMGVATVLAMMAVGPSSAAESNRAQQPWEINWTRAPSMAPATPPASS